MLRKRIRIGALTCALVLPLAFAACPHAPAGQPGGPSGPGTDGSNYGIELTGPKSWTLYVLEAPDFKQPDNPTVTVRNIGDAAVEVKPRVTGDVEKVFDVSPKAATIAVGESETFTISLPEGELHGEVNSATVRFQTDVTQGSLSESFSITYGGMYWESEDSITTSKEGQLSAGDKGVKVSSTANTGNARWYSTNEAVAKVDASTGDLTLVNSGWTILGYVIKESPLTIKGKKFYVYQDWNPPKPGVPFIDVENPTVLKVVFDKEVTFTGGIAAFAVTGSTNEGANKLLSVGGDKTDTLSFNLNGRPVSSDNMKLAYDDAVGNLKYNDVNPENTAVFVQSFNLDVTLTGFSEDMDRPAEVAEVYVDAKTTDPNTFSEVDAKVLYVRFDKAVTVNGTVGFNLTGSYTAQRVLSVSGSGSDTLVFAMDGRPMVADTDFSLNYDMGIGSLLDKDSNRVQGFAKKVDLRNFDVEDVVDNTPPRIVSALITNDAHQTMRVVFNRPVTLDASKFVVKVHGTPWKDYSDLNGKTEVLGPGETTMDYGIVRRTVTSIANVESTGTTWDLTMSEPAKWGEIIRISTTAAGAAKNVSPSTGELSVIRQFIVRSEIERVKEDFEAEAGFYRNGVKDSAIDAVVLGDAMYDGILKANKLQSNNPKAKEVITIVFDTDQVVKSEGPWNAAGNATSLRGKQFDGATIIFTTTTAALAEGRNINISIGNVMPRWAQNNMTMVIDRGIVWQADPLVGERTKQLLFVGDGGKFILDGGDIRGDKSRHAGGVIQMGGGNYGGMLLINSGKITDNMHTSTNTASANTSSVIWTASTSIIVMNGGEISGNKVTQVGTPNSPKAGVIAGNSEGGPASGKSHFYMTGGEIYGNSLTGGYNVPSAGAIIVNGTFMKVGGIIYGSDSADRTKWNTTDFIHAIKPSAVAVLNAGKSAASFVLTDSTRRDNTSVAEDVLVQDSEKDTFNGTATNTIPDWIMSYWDKN